MRDSQASGKKPVEAVEQLRAQSGKLERVSRHITKDKITGSVPKGFGVGVEQARRKTGIDIVGEVPWGTHLCQFYQSKEDLIEILVPYFKQGLENNEFCMWVTAEPLNVKDAKAALKEKVKDLDDYIKKEQIEIVDYSQWYTKTGAFEADKVLEGWVEKEKQAIERGFDGLRFTGNTLWLEKKDWGNFADYEETVNSVIGKYRMLAICSYCLNRCGPLEIIDVVKNHQFAVIKSEGEWISIEFSKRTAMLEALWTSEAKYKVLFEQSGGAIFIADIETGILLECNSKAQALIGRDRREIIGMHQSKLHPEGEAEKYKIKFARHVEKGHIVDFEGEVQHKDGRRIPVWINAQTIKMCDKIVIAGLFIDITERKKAEEKILSLAKFPAENPSPVLRIAKDGEILYSNKAGLELLSHWDVEIGEKAPEKWRCLIKEALESAKPGLQEEEEEVKGRIFSVAISPVAEAGYVNLYARDITERKKAEDALHFTRFALDNAVEPMVCLSQDARYIDANDTFCRSVGYSREELLSMTAHDIDPNYSAKIWPEFWEKLKQSGSLTFESCHRTKDGKVFPIEVTVAFFEYKGKEYHCGFARDLTERKKMEAEARDAQQKLIEQQRHEKEHVDAELEKLHDELVRRTRLAAIGQVSASIAHDLRNPLGSVRNASYFLRRRLSKDEPKASDHLKIIDQEVAKADQIITNLLEMAQPKASHKQVVDLAEIVEQVFGQAKGIEGVRCRTSLVPDPFMVQTDPNQLRQAISNIMGNAVYAMKGHGEFLVEATRDSDYDTLVFRDTGPGFDPEVRDRLFEPLITTKASGTGLGLTICRQIVEKQGGTIHAEDCKGGGAIIRIRLPRQ